MPLTLTDQDIQHIQQIVNEVPTKFGVQLLNILAECQRRQRPPMPDPRARAEETKARAAATAPSNRPTSNGAVASSVE